MISEAARILVLADPLDNQQAGIHVYTREWLRALDGLPPENTYFVARLKKSGDYKNLNEVVLPMPRLIKGGRAKRLFYQLPDLAKEIKADIVIEPAHFGPFNLPSYIKRVTVIHDLTPVKFPHWHRLHSQIAQRWLLKSILRRASLVVTNSQATSRDLQEYINLPSERIAKVYPGVDPMMQALNDKSVLLHYGINRPYFLVAGTIEPRKNLLGLLAAYRIFRAESGYNHQLVVAGARGWKSDAFFEALKAHPNRADIILTGFVPAIHLRTLYSSALAFVFPSFYEGFGFPVVEAMQCGTAVLCSNAGSLPEAGGDAALYFNPQDTAGIARLMKQISDDENLRGQLIEQGKRHAARFSWQDMAMKLDGLLSQIHRGT
jgi:glycosyltransferase involved in cell wall biosynthesis